jgi:(R,R)-butanediol dehydrogenase/meso-butanediol dehydrogenase/diacetyl reductase
VRALVLHAAGDARVERTSDPAAPGPSDVTLRILRAGLCGTDATEYLAGPVLTPLLSRHPATGVIGPVVLGHEFIGVVDEVGAGVANLAVGDRVAAGAGVWCGTCEWCRRGRTNLCASYWTVGLSANGGMAERVTAPAAMLLRIAPGISDNNAALAQPLAVGLHAVGRSRLQAGDVVVVQGVGAIGSFIVAAAVAAGAGAVVAIDVDRARLEIAEKLGASHLVDATEQDPYDLVRGVTGGALADVSIEASGAADGMPRIQRLTRRGGTILLVGLPKRPVAVDAVDLILREIDVTTTVAHVCDVNLPAALDLLGRRDLAELLVERVVPLDRAVEDALVPMAAGMTRGKILVDPQAVPA